MTKQQKRRVYLPKDLYENSHHRFIHEIPKPGKVYGWKGDKQATAYSHTGTPLGDEKEQSTDTHDEDGSQTCYTEWEKP